MDPLWVASGSMTGMPGTAVGSARSGTRHTRRSRPAPLRAHAQRPSPAPVRQPRARLQPTEPVAGAQQTAVLQERARIARELHDSVSQTLYAITLGASRALELLEREEHTAQNLSWARPQPLPGEPIVRQSCEARW
ncbi:MAG: hypothetical protein JO023_13955 [Chloroflexi bacterium]|nr:hypothetical protein [Chloroflexota bacterium]